MTHRYNNKSLLVWYIVSIYLLLLHLSLATLSLSNKDLFSSKSEESLLLNEYEGDGDSYWRSRSYFEPIQNTSYGTIRIKDSFYMQFNLIWYGLFNPMDVHNAYEGIVRIGNPSNTIYDCTGHATRYPALYLDRINKAIQFAISDDIDCWGVGLLNVSYNNLKNDTIYTITIQYNQSWTMIQINDEILYNDKRRGSTPSNTMNKTASVMISDALDPAANVILSDILIISYNDILTMYPSSAPTISPTVHSTTTTTATATTTAITTAIETESPMLSTVGDADLFNVAVKITVSYESDESDQNNATLNALNTTFIETVITEILPSSGSDMRNMSVTHDDDTRDINVSINVPIDNKQDLDILIAYLKYNLTIDLINNIEHSYKWCDIVEVKYDINIKEIYISNEDDIDSNNRNKSNDILPWLPFDSDTVIYIIMAVISLCFCSFVICIYICCRYSKLKRKMRNLEKENRARRSSALSVPRHQILKISISADGSNADINDKNDKHLGIQQNPMAMIHEMEELGLSHSLSNNRMNSSNHSGSADELSLGTHVIPSSEGGENNHNMHQPQLYQRVHSNLPPMDEYDSNTTSDVEDIFNEITTSNFSQKVNMNIINTPNSIRSVPCLRGLNSIHSNSEFSTITVGGNNMHNHTPKNSNNNLDKMIKNQLQITNRYSNKYSNKYSNNDDDDDDDAQSMDSITHSSHEAMYDEGLSRSQYTTNTTNTINTRNTSNTTNGLEPSHQTTH